MPLETFTSGESGHSVRRILTSYGAALCLIGGALGGLALLPKSANKEEAVVDIRLVVPPPPEPEPPPPPAPPLELPKPKPAAVKREVAKVEKAPEPPPAPEPPKPAPPAPAPLGLGQAKGPAKPGQATVSSGSTGGVVGGTGNGNGTGRVVPTASAPAAPPPPKVVALSEDTEPPVALAQAAPAYPPALKAEGVEGFVVVRFLVTETGAIDDLRVVKSSDPRFHDAVLAAVRAWRFKPATSQGRPVPYPKTVKIPFKIRT